MPEKEYKFVPKVGIAISTSDLNVRKGKPSSQGAAVVRQAHSGAQLPYVGYVVDGEPVGGVATWYLTPEGDFFWAGTANTDVAPQPVAPSERCLHKPLDVLICTQRFGERPAFYAPLGSPKGHNGIDFRTRQVSGTWAVPVYAALEGTIVEAAENQWNGKFVRINHANGYQSVYLHLSDIKVKSTQIVTTGMQIGISGNSGSASEAPHLHFGYRPIKFDEANGYMGYIDPVPYFIDPIQFVS